MNETRRGPEVPLTTAERPLVVSALIRGAQPDLRAAVAERALIRTVAEWAPGGGMVLDLQTSRDGEGVRMTVRSSGDAPADWQKDVRRCLAPVAVLAAGSSRATQPAAPVVLAELERDPSRARLRLADDDLIGAPPRQGEGFARTAEVVWPDAVRDISGDVLGAVRGLPNAFVRVHLAASSTMERAMLHDEIEATWSRLSPVNLDAYLGAPVRMRSFVGLRGRGSIASLRAAVRGWGFGLVLREADEAERAEFDGLSPDALAGYVRPEGWALAMLRVPVSGERPVLGMRSIPRPVFERPIDDVPRRAADSLLLGTAKTTQGRRVAVTMPAIDLCRHVAVEGRSGAGKTRFLTSLVAELSRQGVGCTLLEHHGSGVTQALHALDPVAATRAVVVRHGDAAAPGSISIFDEADPDRREQMIAEFTDLIQAIFDPKGEGIVGPRWRRWFTLLCDAVAVGFGQDATLLHVLAVASDPSKVKKLVRRLAKVDRDLALRVSREIAELTGDDAVNLSAWAISKFQPLVAQRTMREIIGRPQDSVDVAEIIEQGRTLLVDLGGPSLGTPAARMLGAMWLLKHWVAMGRRTDTTKPHVILVDEAHLMTFGALPAMLAEARKFGIGIVIASQTVDALSPALQTAIEANVGTHLSFRLGLNTAGRASMRLGGWPAEELVRLPDLRAATTLMTDGAQTEPFLLTVPAWPAVDEASARQAAELEARRIREWAEAGVPPIVTDEDVARALDDERVNGRPAAARPSATRAEPLVPAPAGGSGDAADDEGTGELFLDQWLVSRRASAGQAP